MKFLFSLLLLVASANAFADHFPGDRRPRDFMCQYRDVFRKGYNGYSRWREEAARDARWNCERNSFAPRTCSLNRCERLR
jgi:hypothetical protein